MRSVTVLEMSSRLNQVARSVSPVLACTEKVPVWGLCVPSASLTIFSFALRQMSLI